MKKSLLKKLKILADKNGLTLYELVEMFVKPERERLKQWYDPDNIPLIILFMSVASRLEKKRNWN